MTTIGDAFIKVRPDTDGFEGEAKSGVMGGFRVLGAMGAAAFAAGAAATGAMATLGIQVAASNEQAAMTFTTLLGDATAAGDYLKELQAFAAATPFEFPELRDAASRFLAVGVEADRVIPIMTALGDSTSAMGTGAEGINRATTALTQMQQKGKVTAEEMMQLTEAGIPAWDALAAVLGTDVAGAMDAVSKGTVTAESMFTALETTAGPALERTTGMMKKQSETLAGLFSTLKDTVSMGLGDAMAGAVPAIKAAIPGITEALTGVFATVGPALGELIPMFATTLQGLIPVIQPIVTAVVDGLGGAMVFLQPAMEALGRIMAAIPWDMVAVAITNIASAAATLIPVLEAALKPVLEAIGILLPPISALFEVIAEVLAAVLMPVIEALSPILVRLAEIFDSQINDALEVLVPIIEQVATLFGEALGEVLIELTPVFMELVEAVLPLLPPLVELIGVILPPLIDLLVVLIGPISDVITWFVRLISDAIKPVVGWLSDLIGWISDTIAKFDAFVSAEGLGGVLAAIVGFVDDAWEAFKGFLDDVKEWFGDLPGEIIDALGDLGEVLLNAGKALIGGLLKGMVDKAKDMFSWVGGIGKKIADLKGPLPRDRRLLIPAGRAIMAGFQRGLLDGWRDVSATVGAMTTDLGAGATVAPLALAGAGVREAGATVVFAGPVTFGSDMAQATNELDWFARYRMGAAA